MSDDRELSREELEVVVTEHIAHAAVMEVIITSLINEVMALRRIILKVAGGPTEPDDSLPPTKPPLNIVH